MKLSQVREGKYQKNSTQRPTSFILNSGADPRGGLWAMETPLPVCVLF